MSPEEQTEIAEAVAESPIHITDHAFARGKERLSLSKKSFEKLSLKAYADGVTHSKAKGNLKKYITMIWYQHRNANNVKIYGENLFLFVNNTLVTVYQIPHNLKKLVALCK